MNLFFDISLDTFLSQTEQILRQIDNTEHFNLLLASLSKDLSNEL